MKSETPAATPDEAPLEWQKSVVRDYFEAICIAVVFALFVRTFVVQAFKIPSSSMEQNLLVGDHILVNKFAHAPHAPWMESVLPYRSVRRGDVVVFKYPKDVRRDFIKRVVGSGGDHIQLKAGTVYRDGEPLDEPYTFVQSRLGPNVDPTNEMRRETHGPFAIRPGTYFVMGDNRLNSEDSRYWGTVRESYIKGTALLIYWSFDVPPEYKETEVRGDASTLEKGESLGYTFLHFFDKSRWSRTFKLIN